MQDDYWHKHSNSEELSPAEEKLLWKINMAKGATARGAGIQGAAGGATGAILGGAIGGTLLPVIGAGPGAAIGGAIGSVAGMLSGAFQGGAEEGRVANYEKRLAAIQKQKEKENLEAQAKTEAFSRLLGKYSSY